jgi:hypothetical protein
VSYVERERQRAESLQQEGLDWLHQLHEESRRQTQILADIRTHTRLFYVVLIIWLVLTGIGLLFWLASLSSR